MHYSTGIPDFSRLESRGQNSLLQDHPSVGPVHSMLPSNYKELKIGSIVKLDANGVYWVQEESATRPAIPAIITYPYSNSTDGSGIVMKPTKGCKVAFQQIMKDGQTQALILGYLSPLRVSTDPKTTVSRDSQLEWFTDDQDNPVQLNDGGFSDGDLMISGPSDNKVKVLADGSLLLKSTPKNFINMFPDNRRYSWCKDDMYRTPGSYRGDFSNVTTRLEPFGSYHYHTEKHFVSPTEQRIVYQEEAGLVDKVLTQASAEFDDVPNSEIASSFATNAKTANTTATKFMSGYSVYKRKVYDHGGRMPDRLPRASRLEYFCEEIKTDGAYRVRVGTKPLDSPKAQLGVEVYYKPDGTWYVGSSLGKIKVTTTDMFFSIGNAGAATKEVSLSQIIDFMQKHVHQETADSTLFTAAVSAVTAYNAAVTAAIATGGPAAGAAVPLPPSQPIGITSDTSGALAVPVNGAIPGMATAYKPVIANIPDPSLNWTT